MALYSRLFSFQTIESLLIKTAFSALATAEEYIPNPVVVRVRPRKITLPIKMTMSGPYRAPNIKVHMELRGHTTMILSWTPTILVDELGGVVPKYTVISQFKVIL